MMVFKKKLRKLIEEGPLIKESYLKLHYTTNAITVEFQERYILKP
jgi:hypothetical protein